MLFFTVGIYRTHLYFIHNEEWKDRPKHRKSIEKVKLKKVHDYDQEGKNKKNKVTNRQKKRRRKFVSLKNNHYLCTRLIDSHLFGDKSHKCGRCVRKVIVQERW
jgi:hypothetical protein